MASRGREAYRPRQKDTDFFRRPLRPSRFEGGPETEGPGRGEWQGDENKYTINWGDPNIGKRQAEYKPPEELDPEWYESGDDGGDGPDEDERPAPRRRERPRRRRPRSRFREGGPSDGASVAAAPRLRPREPWRPPVFEPLEPQGRGRAQGRDFPSRGRPAPRDERPGRRPERQPRQPRQQLRRISLEPPVRPVNLEAMAAKGLPKMNLYQLSGLQGFSFF
ncbi:rlmN1 [Symbiodinium natans]|uniref:RlmN1 protein n=1 Tax=Symbiodinium natans TaxID=878477 RepID=A0A812KPA2_9DINO|nr:rlmN1 [Symbiodinium natans]